jgi:hypothetical protein
MDDNATSWEGRKRRRCKREEFSPDTECMQVRKEVQAKLHRWIGARWRWRGLCTCIHAMRASVYVQCRGAVISRTRAWVGRVPFCPEKRDDQVSEMGERVLCADDFDREHACATAGQTLLDDQEKSLSNVPCGQITQLRTHGKTKTRCDDDGILIINQGYC